MINRGEVSITPFTLDYVPEVFALIDADRAHLSQFDDDTADKYPTLQSVFESITRPKDPTRERFVILAANTPVGSINATPTGPEKATYEIGYWVGGQHTGNHFAQLALKCIEVVLLERPDTKELLADTHPDNTASQHVLLTSGFSVIVSTPTDIFFKKKLKW